MKKNLALSLLVASTFAFTAVSMAAAGDKKKKDEAAQTEKKHDTVKVGDKVPDFTATDVNGKAVKFSDYAGKTVVLEWVNPGCPVCKHATESGQVAKMITDAKAIDPSVVFLMVNSTGSTAQNPKATADYLATNKVLASAAIIDGDGKLGHMFDAKTTPAMFVIDSKGVLVYSGAIDDSSNDGETPGKTNYVVNTLTQLKAGETVSPSTTKSYGCGVKYASSNAKSKKG